MPKLLTSEQRLEWAEKILRQKESGLPINRGCVSGKRAHIFDK